MVPSLHILRKMKCLPKGRPHTCIYIYGTRWSRFVMPFEHLSLRAHTTIRWVASSRLLLRCVAFCTFKTLLVLNAMQVLKLCLRTQADTHTHTDTFNESFASLQWAISCFIVMYAKFWLPLCSCMLTYFVSNFLQIRRFHSFVWCSRCLCRSVNILFWHMLSGAGCSCNFQHSLFFFLIYMHLCCCCCCVPQPYCLCTNKRALFEEPFKEIA